MKSCVHVIVRSISAFFYLDIRVASCTSFPTVAQKTTRVSQAINSRAVTILTFVSKSLVDSIVGDGALFIGLNNTPERTQGFISFSFF